MSSDGYRWPAEWEPHRATWLSWPHNPETWPGRLERAEAAFCAMVRALEGLPDLRLHHLQHDFRVHALRAFDADRIDDDRAGRRRCRLPLAQRRVLLRRQRQRSQPVGDLARGGLADRNRLLQVVEVRRRIVAELRNDQNVLRLQLGERAVAVDPRAEVDLDPLGEGVVGRLPVGGLVAVGHVGGLVDVGEAACGGGLAGREVRVGRRLGGRGRGDESDG